jgi:hypothetical protein
MGNSNRKMRILAILFFLSSAVYGQYPGRQVKKPAPDKRKNERGAHLRGNELYCISLDYNQYNAGVNSPCINAVNINLELGEAPERINTLFMFNFNYNFGIATNNAWIMKAFNYPPGGFIDKGHGGGSIDMIGYAMPILYDKRNLALVLGPGAGIADIIFPDVAISGSNNAPQYSAYGTVNICFVYGIRTELFYRKSFMLKVEFISSFGSPTVKPQLKGSEINNIGYNYGHFCFGAGWRINPKLKPAMSNKEENNLYRRHNNEEGR